MDTAQASTPSNRQASQASVPLSAPLFQGREWEYLKTCLDSGWVSSAGPFVERFEREVAAYVGSPEAVAVVNGTAGLHVALRMVGVEPEDEVLVSDVTFIAPANAIRYCQAHPVFIDAEADTWQMDVEKAERFLRTACQRRRKACYNQRTGRRVRAIVPVHILGLACEMDRLMALAREYHLQVVEDAAEAMGVRYRGTHVGTFGDAGVLSFNGNKIITAGGGGMVLTRSRRHAAAARYLTTQAKDDALEYVHHHIGYNYRLPNIQAALGLAQLEQLDGFIAKKRAIAAVYAEALGTIHGLTLMPAPPHTEPTYWLYTVLLAPGTTIARRQAVIRALRAAGIEARPLWHPLHALRPYRRCQRVAIEYAPRLYARAVSLPSGVGLGGETLAECVATVRDTLLAS
ncbi:MAG: LegC family aminotransferase [Candidatus Omnitrophica bacterium]|nr:LegC family aminotransferase [Candidatus Omnitrophota bacterium]